MSQAYRKRAGGLFHRPGLLLAPGGGLVFLLWNAFTAWLNWHEMLLGLAATAWTMSFFAGVLRTAKLHVDIEAKNLGHCWRLPGSILRDGWLITVVLLRSVRGRACRILLSRMRLQEQPA